MGHVRRTWKKKETVLRLMCGTKAVDARRLYQRDPRKFCGSCNRVRLTSRGFLKLCLCYENGVDLREVLQNGTAADLRDVMAQAILKKPMEHCFERPKDMTEHHLMSGIGG